MEYKEENKICQNCKHDFVIEPDDFGFYEKMKVPMPTWCPECRMVRRLSFRNERNLFRKKDAHTGEDSFSGFPPEANLNTYENEYWHGDKWDALDYGVDYDFSKPFFIQFAELSRRVPRRAVLGVSPGINTEYTNFLFHSKEAFLSYSVVNSEYIYYCGGVDFSKQCVDSTHIKECESCYGLLHGTRNYNSKNLVDSRDCIDSMYLYDCATCSDCFMSSNLRNQKYVFRGTQLTKEEYKKEIEKIW